MQRVTKQWAFGALAGVMAQLFQPVVQAQPEGRQQYENDNPSRELLEFLVDYGDTDDETFDLIVIHGKRDLGIYDEQKKDSAQSVGEGAATTRAAAKGRYHKELGNGD